MDAVRKGVCRKRGKLSSLPSRFKVAAAEFEMIFGFNQTANASGMSATLRVAVEKRVPTRFRPGEAVLGELEEQSCTCFTAQGLRNARVQWRGGVSWHQVVSPVVAFR